MRNFVNMAQVYVDNLTKYYSASPYTAPDAAREENMRILIELMDNHMNISIGDNDNYYLFGIPNSTPIKITPTEGL